MGGAEWGRGGRTLVGMAIRGATLPGHGPWAWGADEAALCTLWPSPSLPAPPPREPCPCRVALTDEAAVEACLGDRSVIGVPAQVQPLVEVQPLEPALGREGWESGSVAPRWLPQGLLCLHTMPCGQSGLQPFLAASPRGCCDRGPSPLGSKRGQARPRRPTLLGTRSLGLPERLLGSRATVEGGPEGRSVPPPP